MLVSSVDMRESSSGRYGEILEHPWARRLIYMVIGPDPEKKYDDDGLLALVVSDGALYSRTGGISQIARHGWIIRRG